eukprot:39268-Karenia_brevis.AAC.1
MATLSTSLTDVQLHTTLHRHKSLAGDLTPDGNPTSITSKKTTPCVRKRNPPPRTHKKYELMDNSWTTNGQLMDNSWTTHGQLMDN